MANISFSNANLDRYLQGLFAFDQVAKYGSFTEAARAMGSTQSAISQKIRALEEGLNAELFVRLHRGVRLTTAGQDLLMQVMPAMSQLAQSVAQIKARSHKPRARLAMDFAFASFWLLPRLSALRQVLSNELDLQILTSQNPTGPQVEDQDITIDMRPLSQCRNQDVLLFCEQAIAVCSPDFLARNGPFLTAADLVSTNLLNLSAPTQAPWHSWRTWFSAQDIGKLPELSFTSFSNYDLVIQAATAGQGVALGWLGLVDGLLARGDLVQVTAAMVKSEVGYVLSRHGSTDHNGITEVFNWIAAEARR